MNVIVTGVTGMVGEGVLHTCLDDPRVNKVLVIGRRSCEVQHDKLTEILHQDFSEFDSIRDKLQGFDACFHCMGISSMGLSEDEFRHITYNMTMALAQTLHANSPGMTFCYVSGAGTDSSEKGRMMWARVKGKTENDLLALFDHAYMFRPGMIEPMKGMKNTLSAYKYLGFLMPLFRLLAPGSHCKLEQIGATMILVASEQPEERIIDSRKIRELGN